MAGAYPDPHPREEGEPGEVEGSVRGGETDVVRTYPETPCKGGDLRCISDQKTSFAYCCIFFTNGTHNVVRVGDYYTRRIGKQQAYIGIHVRPK